MTETIVWETLSPEEKKKQLFLNQKKLLDTFLEKNAISKTQYDKSLTGKVMLMASFNNTDIYL